MVVLHLENRIQKFLVSRMRWLGKETIEMGYFAASIDEFPNAYCYGSTQTTQPHHFLPVT